MTPQPAVPCPKCPVCKGDLRKSKNAEGFYYCGSCHSLINASPNEPFREDDYMGPGCADHITDSPTPSLELGPDTEVGKLGPGEMFDEGGMIYLRDLDEKYQQALLKGGLDREKVIRHLKEFNDIRSDYFDFHKEGSPAYKFYEGSEDAVNRIIEALESGALDVTTEPRKEVPQ